MSNEKHVDRRLLELSEQNAENSAIIKSVAKTTPRRRKSIVNCLTNPKSYPRRKVRRYTDEELKKMLKEVYEQHRDLSLLTLRKVHDKDKEACASANAFFKRFVRQSGDPLVLYDIIGVSRPLKSTKNDLFTAPDNDVHYYFYLFSQLGIKNTRLYNEARRKYPEVVPPYAKLVKNLGGMRTLKKLFELESCSEQVKRLLLLMEKLGGRWPRKKLCRENNVDRTFLERRFGGRRAIKELFRELYRAKKHEEKA